MFVVWFAPFLIFVDQFCTLKVWRVFKETCKRKKTKWKKSLIAMFYSICLLKSSRIYYCANAAITLRSCITTHLSTQGLKEICDIFINCRVKYGNMECFMNMDTCLRQKYLYLTEKHMLGKEMCTFGLLYHSWQFIVLYIIFACVIWGFLSKM